MPNTDQIVCVCCEKCLRQAESAGQLEYSTPIDDRWPAFEGCEQCGLPLIGQETYIVVIRP